MDKNPTTKYSPAIEDKTINFICPECENNTLGIYQIAHEIMSVDGLGKMNNFEYLMGGEVLETDIVDVLDYGCSQCRFSIGGDEGEAIEWLREHNMIGK